MRPVGPWGEEAHRQARQSQAYCLEWLIVHVGLLVVDQCAHPGAPCRPRPPHLLGDVFYRAKHIVSKSCISSKHLQHRIGRHTCALGPEAARATGRCIQYRASDNYSTGAEAETGQILQHWARMCRQNGTSSSDHGKRHKPGWRCWTSRNQAEESHYFLGSLARENLVGFGAWRCYAKQ